MVSSAKVKGEKPARPGVTKSRDRSVAYSLIAVGVAVKAKRKCLLVSVTVLVSNYHEHLVHNNETPQHSSEPYRH
jgi:hypothetical protein